MTKRGIFEILYLMRKDQPSSRITYIIFLGVVLFAGGFFFGLLQNRSMNSAEASSAGIDMRPFWQALATIEEKFVAQDPEFVIDHEVLIHGAIEGMVESLGDPYSVFFPPAENKEFQEAIDGNFEGVGMEVGIEEEVLTVIAPLKGTPAEEAGVKAGDVILEIDGVSTQGKTIDDSISLIRGEKGTTVEITVLRKGLDDLLKISIVRDVIEIPTLRTEVRDDIFIISLYNFTGSVKQDFRRALNEFVQGGHDKLILDLRGNPGGYLDAALDIAGYFLPEGKVVLREDFGGEGEKLLRSSGGIFEPGEITMVVLIDEGSASASEIVAGALSEHGVATTMGVKTFGKGSVQELISLPGRTSLKLTIAQWLTPNGISISENGLEPDIVVEFEDEDYETQYDRQLEEAILYLEN